MKTDTISDALQRDPIPEILREHPHTKVKYLPISSVEASLDKLFGWDGWQLTEFQTNVMVNEVTGSITLSVWSENRGEWISRVGAGAAQITLKSVSKEDYKKGIRRMPTEIEFKQMNAMETAFPHLLADCVKNAAKKFGKVLGRDVSRKKEDVEILTKMESSARWQDFLTEATQSQTLTELTEAVRKIPSQFHSLPQFGQLVQEVTAKLSENALPESVPAQTLFDK